jgi:uncharacterized membrane protein YkoI
MRKFAGLLGACGMVAAFCLFTVAQADEEKVPLDKVPKAVVEAVKTRFPDAKLESAEKETKDDKTVYEIAIKNKNQKIEVTLTADGKIVEIEKQIAASDLPKTVSETLAAKYPKADFKVIEEVIKVKDGKEKLEYYEVHLVTAQGAAVEVQVTANGKILAEEKQDKEKKEEKKK